MKKDRLYRVTKGNLFALGDQMQTTGLSVSGTPTFANYVYDKAPNIPKVDLSNYYKPNNNFFSNQTVQQGFGFAANMADSIPTGDKRGLYDTLDPMYHLAGGRESAIGNGLSDVGVGLFKTGASTGNAGLMLAGGIAKGAGGLYNTLFGTKWNDDLINNIEDNTQKMNNLGNAFGRVTDNDTFFNFAGNLSSGKDFTYKDLGSTGWFKSNSSLKRKARKLDNAQNRAESFQLHAMTDAADRLDKRKDRLVLANTPYFAYGGPLQQMDDYNMGAIEYGFMSDYLTAKQKQNEVKNKLTGITGTPAFMQSFADGGEIHIKHPGRLTRLKERTGKTEAELWAEGKPEVKKMITFARNARAWSKANGGKLHKDGVSIPENVLCSRGKLFHGGGCLMPNMFNIGGDIQTNSADWTTGLTHVNAGGSHEENPNQGIQMGVDREGTPNLVEENETIFNDYVYSNRITLDDEAKKAFHIGKKRDITYADLSKKLEKEASERPNDPISQAALKVQMQDLADQQERQKQEMEAERARKAFEALSDEEKVAVIQQHAQQEQAAQQQAMQEQAMTEQQMMQEAAAGQQGVPTTNAMDTVAAGQPEVMEGQPVMAEGGKINTFAGTQSGSNQMRNAGTWKEGDSSSNWNTYTRGGLRDYLENIVKRIQMAPDEKTANEIRQEAINTVAGIQQAYAKAYQNDLTPVSESDAVKTLQSVFQNAGGNKYFGSIADNINLPQGHNTPDTEAGGWVDSLWGPRTSIRNWGSTEYGNADYYKDIADLAQQAGMVYAPNADWTYGDNTLYGLSIPEVATAPIAAEKPGYTPEWQGGAADTAPQAASEAVKKPKEKDEWEVTPNYKNDKLRYAGLLGPAVGLGMMAAGIGRPDNKRWSNIVEAAQGPAVLADYQPIGNYLRYKPLDIWAEQNRLNVNSRATDRALANNSSPIGTRMAGLLANEYNNQIGSGNLFRQAQEYNDTKDERTQTFNRGTDQFNAEAYNRAALTNAEIRNRQKQFATNIAMQAEQAKANSDADWYNGIYGNIGGLFKGIADVGRENAQHNMIAEMAADGIFGTMSPRTNTGRRGKYLTFTKKNSACKGGKINRKKGGK